MTTLDDYPSWMEDLRDAARDDEFFNRPCPSTNDAGEHCALTIHLTGLHTWERP